MAAPNITTLRAKSKLPANQAGGRTVADFFQANRGAIAAVLPKHIDADRMLKLVQGAMRSTPKLMECTVASLFGAAIEISKLGLEPNDSRGLAYLIPFRNNKAQSTDVQVIIGYRGLLDLVRRSGQVASVYAECVREGDEFEYQLGDRPRVTHKPDLSISTTAKNIIAVYAVAYLKGADVPIIVIMGRGDIDAIKARSKTSNFGPWVTDYGQMACKTALRRICKLLPMSIEAAGAMRIEEESEEGTLDFGSVIEGEYQEEGETAPVDPKVQELPPAITAQEIEEELDGAAKLTGDARKDRIDQAMDLIGSLGSKVEREQLIAKAESLMGAQK